MNTQDGDVLLKALLATAVDGIIVMDDHGTIRIYNEACAHMFGYSQEDIIGQNVKLLMPSTIAERHDAYLETYRRTGVKQIIGVGRDDTGRRKDGSEFPIHISVGEGRLNDQRVFVGILTDISERKARELRIQELQHELLHATRLAATGELGAALAHELNQPLTAILNYTHVLQETKEWVGPDSSARARDILAKIGVQAARAGEVIRRLRGFVAKREPARTSEDLNATIKDSLGLALVGPLGRQVSLRSELAPDIAPVLIDKVQIQQVLINLIRNALEAMEGAPDAALIVKSRAEDETFARVTIADNGPGLAPQVAAKLFRPFVTSKPDGLGIGLSICRTIIEAHGGRIWAESSETGTKFHCRLPFAAPKGAIRAG
jgi:two-component system sensor kinase FixL